MDEDLVKIRDTLLQDKLLVEIVNLLSEPRCFTDLGKILQIGPSALNYRLKKFTELGVLEKMLDPKDEKVKYKLTKKGRDYIILTNLIRGMREKLINKEEMLYLYLVATRDSKEIEELLIKTLLEKLQGSLKNNKEAVIRNWLKEIKERAKKSINSTTL